MSDLAAKLNEYQDFELAFLVAYKLDSYSDSIVEQIQNEVASRNLTQKQMNDLVQEKSEFEIKDHEKKICPRCTSKKILVNREDFYGNNKAFGLDSGKPLTYLEFKICAVCGWNFMADETKYEKRSRIVRSTLSFIVVILFGLILLWFFDDWMSN